MRIGRATIENKEVWGAIDDGAFHALADGPFDIGVRRSGESFDLSELTLLSPTKPRTTLLILGGFLKGGAVLPPGTQPRLVAKITSHVTGDGAEIVVPPFVTTDLLMEVELAAVIGREVRGASVEEARDAILGYACFNDASAPQFMLDASSGKLLADPDYFRTKSIDTFASMGPWIETSLTEQDLLEGLELTTHVNGELMASGNTRMAKFLPSEVVSYVSQAIALRPGDVIALGTPQPCSAGPGDVVTLSVEGIGSFTNKIIAAA